MEGIAEERVTYRQVLAITEFRALFLSQALSVAGDQIARIALALLVYERSGSAFGASATYACSFLTWLVGGPFLSALADRYVRRDILVISDVSRGILVSVLLVAHPPLWLVFAVLGGIGLLAPPFESARSAIVPDILSGEHYVVGNTLINVMMQAAQVGGFFFGGVLVAVVSVRGALAIDVLTFAASAIAIALCIRGRPSSGRTDAISAEIAAGFRLVRRDPYLRGLLTYGVIATAVAIVPEGLAVAVAGEGGGGAVAAGALTATLPLGYVLASTVLLRVPADSRPGWLLRLTLVLCLPLLLTPVSGPTVLTALLWVVAGLGTAVQLIASVAYVAAAPRDMRGRLFGIASTALMLTQGVTLLIAGALADVVGARWVVAGAAAAGLCLLLGVRGTLHPHQFTVQGKSETGRSSTR